jgi:hypothetical protein
MWVQKTAPASRDAGAGWRTDLLTSKTRISLSLVFLWLHAFKVSFFSVNEKLKGREFLREEQVTFGIEEKETITLFICSNVNEVLNPILVQCC